jgi:hypothetical protein
MTGIPDFVFATLAAPRVRNPTRRTIVFPELRLFDPCSLALT